MIPGFVDFLASARLDRKIHFQRLCFFGGHCITDGFVVQRRLASLEERNSFHYCCYFILFLFIVVVVLMTRPCLMLKERGPF